MIQVSYAPNSPDKEKQTRPHGFVLKCKVAFLNK